jgi:hypothetical protein
MYGQYDAFSFSIKQASSTLERLSVERREYRIPPIRTTLFLLDLPEGYCGGNGGVVCGALE